MPICPCGGFVHPAVIFNPPGLSSISNSPGDYLAFRHALLRALPNETELAQIWRPGVEGDLAVQMVEWWAYLCDVLGFYNERIATESYLRTATLPESVNRLIQLLGYRPRPALGARGTLAALLTGRGPIVLPKGLQIQSKPGPGKQPQVFELEADTTARTPDIVTARPVPQQQLLSASAGQTQLPLAGKVSGIKAGDKLLLTDKDALNGNTPTHFLWLSVKDTAPATDPYGQPVTQVQYDAVAGGVSQQADPANYVLLRSAQSAGAWSYPVVTPKIVTTSFIELATLARGLDPGQLLLAEVSGTAAVPTTPVIVQSNVESVWYGNGDGPTAPTESPPGSIPAVAIPHATITFAQALPDGPWNDNKSAVTARWGWTSVGKLAPNLSPSDVTLTGGNGTLTPQAGAFPPGSHPVLLQDTNGTGASAQADVGSDGTLALSLISTLPAGGLVPPIDVLFNLVSVSRGKSVPNGILGSGNAAIAGQDFTLSQSPVTYQQDPASKSGENYSSTVRVWVNQVEWTEVRSFFYEDRNAQVFVLREDEAGKTHVVFGDGVNGARLPTGTNNVVASYRTGAGADAPAPGTLTTAQSPPPGLKSLRNPGVPTGGADADPPDRIRSLAPASVFTFGRAVSLDDYQAIVANAPGVVQSKADFVFDPLAQRPVVTLWVAGDDGAVAAAQTALAGTSDPSRPVRILAATPVEYKISLTYLRDPRREDDAVRMALHAALLDPDAGLFGARAIRIGEVIYGSQIYQACLAVPGVQAVHSLIFAPFERFRPLIFRFPRLVSFAPRPAAICAGDQHDPGPGGYFTVPDDGRHLTLSSGAAS